MYTIRLAQAADYEQIAEIESVARPEPETAADVREKDERAANDPEIQATRLVAVAPDGHIAGFALVEHVNWDPQERWYLFVCTHPADRNQGVGSALYKAGLSVAREAGGTEIECWVRGGDEAARAWAERRGFVAFHQRTESVLELAAWDGAPFADAIPRVLDSGLALTVHGGDELPESTLQQVYELDRVTSPDIPIWQPDTKFPSYESYRQNWLADRTPRKVALAWDGERVVGLSIIHFLRHPRAGAYTGYTAVLREYRGRGIAMALKVLTIEEAVRRGVPHMRTNNDPTNAPMLAVNKKLGYQFIPGPLILKQRFDG